jgi:alkanesulfonate monooxygenase SsuD/methylene tetrahydromethanopterin reductase-like flavin-dependent oxidoreductase (luciferase family)
MVTTTQATAMRNIGREGMIGHAERYRIAADYLEACLKLWEGSWEDGALRRDAVAGVYTDPAKVHDIAHDGPYFCVPGIFVSEPSPQRTPFLFQAGTSGDGREFAGRNAEGVFTALPSRALLADAVRDIRASAVAAGRSSDDVPRVEPPHRHRGPDPGRRARRDRPLRQPRGCADAAFLALRDRPRRA